MYFSELFTINITYFDIHVVSAKSRLHSKKHFYRTGRLFRARNFLSSFALAVESGERGTCFVSVVMVSMLSF